MSEVKRGMIATNLTHLKFIRYENWIQYSIQTILLILILVTKYSAQ